jgi:hypothetical protein
VLANVKKLAIRSISANIAIIVLAFRDKNKFIRLLIVKILKINMLCVSTASNALSNL